MLQGYFDDSGTHDSSDVVVWAGFIGTPDQWAKLSDDWNARLRAPFAGEPGRQKPPLAMFHLAECVSKKGAFRDYSEAECDRIQWLFREIIVQSGVIGLGYAVDRIAYSALSDEDRQRMGDAEAACVSGCVMGADRAVEDHFGEPAPLTMNFDQRRTSALERMGAEEIVLGYGQLRSITALSLRGVAQCPPLQAADILATEHRWDVQRRIRGEANPRPHFASFMHRIHCQGFLWSGLEGR